MRLPSYGVLLTDFVAVQNSRLLVIEHGRTEEGIESRRRRRGTIHYILRIGHAAFRVPSRNVTLHFEFMDSQKSMWDL